MASGQDEDKDPIAILEERTPADVYAPSDEEKELAAALKVRFMSAYRHRLPHERQWEVNWLYMKGEQPIRNFTTGEVFRLPQDDGHRLISNNNVIRPTARSLLGKLTRNIPTCVVVPPSADLSDLHGSMVADSLLYFLRRKEKLDVKYIDIYRNTITFGMGFMKLSWDREAGDRVAMCPECNHRERDEELDGKECPRCGEELMMQHQEQTQLAQQQAQLEMEAGGMTPIADLARGGPALVEIPPPEIPLMSLKKEGDIRVDVLDPREVYIDPSATKMEEAQWWCHRVPLPVSAIRQRFPSKAAYIDKEGGITADAYVTLVRGSSTYRSASRQLEDHAYLYEYHEKATTDFPNGRVIWTCNDIILEEIANPYDGLGRFPLYTFYFEMNAGELYGESFVEQASPIQRELNILLTQMREHRELTNNPQLFAPMNCGIAIEEMDTTAGRIVYYNPMSKTPEYRQTPGFPNYVYEEVKRMEGQIRTHASVTEQEVGQTQSDASGRYAAIIEAEASQQVAPILRYNHTEWVELHRGMLTLAQQFYTMDRTWTITGKDRPESYAFDQMNLAPGWDVDVQEDDSLSNNHAVRLTQNMELAKVVPQLFMDKAGAFDTKLFARKAGLKLPGMTPETKSADHAHAANIPYLLKEGKQYTVRQWDDPEIFAEELEAWLKGPGRSEDEQLVNQVAQYYTYYLQRTQAALMQQQQMLQMQAGGMPQPGGETPVANMARPPNAQAPSVTEEADQNVQQADKAAESASRQTAKHEG